jgi:geranylgeranyl diphosphate synthase type II
MDGSPFRRNRETIHKKWDEARAILTGDLMIAFSYSLLPHTLPRSMEINQVFTKAFLEVNEGQGYDMDFNARKDLAFDDYLLMIKMKTSSLLMCPALMAGHIGEANKDEMLALNDYAENLGIAFQIQDDYLDMTADEAVLGKKTGLDIVDGKKTCLIIKTKDKKLDPQDRELMDKFYAENGLSEEYIPQMDAIFKKYGSYDEINMLADTYFSKAIAATKALPQNDYTEMLVWLCESLNKREK